MCFNVVYKILCLFSVKTGTCSSAKCHSLHLCLFSKTSSPLSLVFCTCTFKQKHRNLPFFGEWGGVRFIHSLSHYTESEPSNLCTFCRERERVRRKIVSGPVGRPDSDVEGFCLFFLIEV